MNLPNLASLIPQSVALSACKVALGRLDEQVANDPRYCRCNRVSEFSQVTFDGYTFAVNVSLDCAQ